MGRFVRKQQNTEDVDLPIPLDDSALGLNFPDDDDSDIVVDVDDDFDDKKPALASADELPNSDLSLSNYTLKDKKDRPKRNKFLFIFLGIAVLLSLVAIGSVGFLVLNASPPKAVLVHIESDNINNQSTAKYGSMITLTFAFDKPISNLPTVIINDREVEVFGKGKNFYAKYFVQNQGTSDLPVNFLIKDYHDNFNRKGSPVTSTTDLSRVTIVALK